MPAFLHFIPPGSVSLFVISAKWLSLFQMRCPFVIAIFLLIFGATGFGQTDPVRTATNGSVSKQIRCYPNHATTAVFFELKARNPQEPAQLRIYNFLGKKVVDITRLTTSTRIDLNNFNRGIYIYQLSDARGRVLESGKFHVERP
jgi:hypothetical protein